MNRLGSYLLPALVLLTLFEILTHPALAFSGASYGLNLWWNVVFPALLPFFIGSEILLGLGVVHFIGVLLKPFVRPIFNVPGEGAFVLAMGLTCGFPVGSILTAKLRRERLVSKAEGERLLSFSNTAGPLFLSGAIAVGMFHNPSLGAVIMVANYLSALTIGLFSRGKGAYAPREVGGTLLVRALSAMDEAKSRDSRPFGQLLGDAVRSSVNTLLLIGGLIVLFASLLRIMAAVGLVAFIAKGLVPILALFGFSPALAPALVSGFFEITIGSQMAASSGAPLPQALAATSAILAWSGLSVLAQVASVIQGTDLSLIPYIRARVMQAILAPLFTLLLLGPSVSGNDQMILPAAMRMSTALSPLGGWGIFAWGCLIGLSLLLILGKRLRL